MRLTSQARNHSLLPRIATFTYEVRWSAEVPRDMAVICTPDMLGKQPFGAPASEGSLWGLAAAQCLCDY